MAKHNEVGFLGENLSANWCLKHGFSIVDKNYRKKYGEIDIVARGTTGKLHFIEVKAVSYETKQQLKSSVSYGTYRPEENVHEHKQIRLSRTIQSWIMENKYNGEWQIDILAVRMVSREKYATIKYIENVIFE